jgi:predicted glycoside hydrolase/deacetylase ChbG (UPF0249 family)
VTLLVTVLCVCGVVQAEVSAGVDHLKDATRKLINVQDSHVERIHTHTVQSLKGIVQRLAQEKVFLTAAVNNAEQNVQETNTKVMLCLIRHWQLLMCLRMNMFRWMPS